MIKHTHLPHSARSVVVVGSARWALSVAGGGASADSVAMDAICPYLILRADAAAFVALLAVLEAAVWTESAYLARRARRHVSMPSAAVRVAATVQDHRLCG